ncbi:MAG: hypothetical protein K2Y02_08960 [Burkholderiaceae bacterium]|nr:hypothetical protein [Burkholderiaceae bacterium]
MGPVDIHLDRLRAREPDLQVQELPDGSRVISIPHVALPAGWNKPQTAVHLVAPQGYPFAQPDCFWAEQDLRLSSGAFPQNANLTNPIPHLGQPMLWFSWHLQTWNATRDDLTTWLTVIRQRLAQPV